MTSSIRNDESNARKVVLVAPGIPGEDRPAHDCRVRADFSALIATVSEPSVPFLKPNGVDRPLAPNGPISAVMRLYWPNAEVLDGTWKLPPLTPVP